MSTDLLTPMKGFPIAKYGTFYLHFAEEFFNNLEYTIREVIAANKFMDQIDNNLNGLFVTKFSRA